MSEVPVVIRLLVEGSQVWEEIAAMQAEIDRTEEEWRQTRARIISGLRDISQIISYSFQSVRLLLTVTNQAMDPVYSALMGVLSSTVSLMLATAAIMTAESLGILAPIGIALAAAALGIQGAQAVKLEMQHQTIKKLFDKIGTNLDTYGRGIAGGYRL